MHVQLARCITSFGRSRRLLDISRFLFFPLAPHSRPSAFLATLQHPCAMCPCTCALYMRTCLCLSEHCARLVAVPCRCMQILSPNLVSARASVLPGRGNGEGWKGWGGGVRYWEGGSEPREAINCGSSRGTVTRPRRRLRNCGCHDIDTSAPTT